VKLFYHHRREDSIVFTLSESFEKCPRSANIASAPEILAALEMPKHSYNFNLLQLIKQSA
jgi:hypothetical protein